MEAGRRGEREQVLAAGHQTAGRGRLDREWIETPGTGLLVSVLLREGLTPERLPWVVSTMALSAVEACRATTSVDVVIKWPNDLLIGGRKLAGILAEHEPSSPSGPFLVVGMGLNVAPAKGLPDEVRDRSTALLEHSETVIAPSDLLEALLPALERNLRLGLSELRDAYRSACVTIGAAVAVDLGEETIVGECVGVDDDGRLEVHTAAGHRVLAVGDVVHAQVGER